MYFKDIIGQQDIKQQLTKSAQRRVVPHARIFCGRAGSGTFPLALAYARYLNCRNRSETDACGKCASCVKFDRLEHPDLHFIFPIAKKEKKKEICDDYLPEWRSFLKGNTYFNPDSWIHEIEPGNSQVQIYARESEEIIRKLSLKIYEADYRILLVWLPEKMHISCANKLLKIIEEPPLNTVILMVSEEPDMVLGTILSRAQHLYIRPVSGRDITHALIDREMLEKEQAEEVAHLAAGDYLRALQLIRTDDENSFYLDEFISMMRNSWARNVKGMKERAELLTGIGRERQKKFLAYCQHLIRENFMCIFKAGEIIYMNRKEKEFSLKFSSYVNERNVVELMDELAKAERHIMQNVNAKIVFFDLALRITVFIRR